MYAGRQYISAMRCIESQKTIFTYYLAIYTCHQLIQKNYKAFRSQGDYATIYSIDAYYYNRTTTAVSSQ